MEKKKVWKLLLKLSCPLSSHGVFSLASTWDNIWVQKCLLLPLLSGSKTCLFHSRQNYWHQYECLDSVHTIFPFSLLKYPQSLCCRMLWAGACSSLAQHPPRWGSASHQGIHLTEWNPLRHSQQLCSYLSLPLNEREFVGESHCEQQDAGVIQHLAQASINYLIWLEREPKHGEHLITRTIFSMSRVFLYFLLPL